MENQIQLKRLNTPTWKSPRSFEMMDSRDSPWLFWFEKSVDRSLHIHELLIVSLKRWFWWRGLGTSRQHLISEICAISCVWQQQHYIYNSYFGHFQMTSTTHSPTKPVQLARTHGILRHMLLLVGVFFSFPSCFAMTVHTRPALLKLT